MNTNESGRVADGEFVVGECSEQEYRKICDVVLDNSGRLNLSAGRSIYKAGAE